MIRHRPTGSGHPYSHDTEQRSPVHPVAGEPVTVGVRTSGSIATVRLELVTTDARGTETVSAHTLERASRTSRGQAVDGGHLASAQARLARDTGGWRIELAPVEANVDYRYRFIATTGADDETTESTRWFGFRAGSWRAAPAGVAVVGGHAGGEQASGALDSERTLNIVPGSVEVLDDGRHIRRVRFALPLGAGEHVSGFGERFDALDHRGSSLDSVVFEQYKSQGAHRRTYLPMPFAHVVGGRGWGFHVRSSRRTAFDLGESSSELLRIEVDVDSPSDAESVLELALYEGTPQQVLGAFLAEVGAPRELPDWVFRLWASGNEWNTQESVLRQMDLHREHGIPVGSVVIEAWSDESTFTAFRDARYEVTADGSPHTLADFDFPPDGAWPDPKGMVDTLHDRDIRVHLWQIPLIKMRPHPAGQAKADAEAALREGVLIREPSPSGSLRPYRNRGWWFPLSLMPDLGDQRAARWWTQKRRYLVEEVGIDGFKTDGGEHAWGDELVYLDGTRGDEGNNRFPVHYARAYGELLESAGKAPVTFSRAGFTGSQAHGAFWAGDENSTWEAFRWSMLAGLSASASGILYWGWDIAGFSGDTPSAELYLRAMAASAFVPIMQYHSEFNHHRLPLRDRTPWNIAELTGEPSVIPLTRELVLLRERLVPYLAEQARLSIATSRPLMRPLYFEHPRDEKLWRFPVQWMLGDDLLVAPVLEPGVTEWPVYLPEGEWVDAWTGETLAGSVEIAADAPLGRVPVFVRAESWEARRGVFPAP